MVELARELCMFPSGVVAAGNVPLFARISQEVPLELFGYHSGEEFNGWLVPDDWTVHAATIRRDGEIVFDGRAHTLGVARYSRSFQGSLDWEELAPHLVTNPDLPDAYMFHCMWQYRPWDADWALSVPHETYRTLGAGRYEVDLRTTYSPGEMLVGHHEVPGRTDRTIVFHSNTCHPHQANDGFAGTAVLIRLMQWLATRDNRYTYRLVVGPEHLGTIFYLRDHTPEELQRVVSGVFAEMPGTAGAFKVASSFLGGQVIDRALANAAQHVARTHELVPWRQGAGNDETVWEAPGYEVPFPEVTRSEHLMAPYREYHSSRDDADLMDPDQLEEFLDTLKATVEAIEDDAVAHRQFDGLVCLSSPQYRLYKERPDPSVAKNLPPDSEAWGYLLDCLLRYFDGSTTILDIAERHGLPFAAVRDYLREFEAAGLIELESVWIERPVPGRTGREAGR
jgi:aminopeptidase-like protein